MKRFVHAGVLKLIIRFNSRFNGTVYLFYRCSLSGCEGGGLPPSNTASRAAPPSTQPRPMPFSPSSSAGSFIALVSPPAGEGALCQGLMALQPRQGLPGKHPGHRKIKKVKARYNSILFAVPEKPHDCNRGRRTHQSHTEPVCICQKDKSARNGVSTVACPDPWPDRLFELTLSFFFFLWKASPPSFSG